MLNVLSGLIVVGTIFSDMPRGSADVPSALSVLRPENEISVVRMKYLDVRQAAEVLNLYFKKRKGFLAEPLPKLKCVALRCDKISKTAAFDLLGRLDKKAASYPRFFGAFGRPRESSVRLPDTDIIVELLLWEKAQTDMSPKDKNGPCSVQIEE